MATSTCLFYIIRLQADFKISSSVFINKNIHPAHRTVG